MIKVKRWQYVLISRLYRFGGFFCILGLLTGFAWLVGKPIEFICAFLPYFITKNFSKNQFHAKSLKKCFEYSLIIFSAIILLLLPKEISINFAPLIGLVVAFISFKIGEIQLKIKDYDYIEPRYNYLVEFYKTATEQKPFCTDTCTEEELRTRCADIHLSQDNTELAVEFFIRKTKQSIIADRLCIDEKSVTTRKKRLKAKLQQTCD